MGLYFQPIEGVNVDSPDGVVHFPGFDLVNSHAMLEYLAGKLGDFSLKSGIDDLLKLGGQITYIVISRESNDERDDEGDWLAHEALLCSSVLSIAFWIHSDLRYTIHLRHEAYLLKGNISGFVPTGTKKLHRRQEHASRGFTVFTINKPIDITPSRAARISEHPLLHRLFALCSSIERTEVMEKVLHSARQLYFAYSAHFPEAQVIGAASSIDALISTTMDEQSHLLSQLEGPYTKKRYFSPNYLIKSMLGLQELSKLVVLSDSPLSEDSIFATYKIRNDIAHNGASCTDIDACNSFRLALRVLLCVADASPNYVHRRDIVFDLIHRLGERVESGGALQNTIQDDYPWFTNGMPDFLPFVVARFFAPGTGYPKMSNADSIAKACCVITHQRDVTFEKAIRALEQSEFIFDITVDYRDLKERYLAALQDETILEHASICRSTSPIAWHECQKGPFSRFVIGP